MEVDGSLPSGPVFRGKRGPYTARGVEYLLSQLGRVADVHDVHPHRFRHDAARRLVEVTDLPTVAAWLGHERLDTVRVYSHPDEAALERAATALEQAHWGNTLTSASMLTAPRRYRLTVEAYDRMIEAGVFPPDARIELLEGVLYEMPPMGRPHQAVLRVLLQVFAPMAAEQRLLVQMPIILPVDSEPEPDLAIVAPGTSLDKPGVDHVVLAIEVGERSRRLDLEQKAPLYQRAGLVETWVLDLREQRVVVFPREGGSVVYQRGQGTRLTPRAVPEVTLDVDALFAAVQP